MSSPNALLDWVRALQTLAPADEEARAGIAAALGMQLRAHEQIAVAERSDGRREPKAPGRASGPSQPPRRKPESEALRQPLQSELTALDSPTHGPPDWLQTVPHLAKVDVDELRSPMPFEPLLRREWTRAILTAVVATSGSSGEIDLTHVMDSIARAKPVEALPRRGAPTLARGVQVLVDVSETMQPFAADQAAACAAVARVVGRDKSQALKFSGCPIWGAGPGLADEWTRYVPPALGTPILVLTDIGIGRPATTSQRPRPEDWIAVAEIARRAGCPLVVLVPYEPARWPPALHGRLTIVPWDRSTTVATVTRLVGRPRSRRSVRAR